MTLRIAIVTDIHHGKPSTAKRGDAALGLMGEFARFVKDSGATHVLDMGDRISDENRDTDLVLT
ncbi:MAG: metallophosphoesterase-domain-containing protein, partial [Cypionkella sp.]|nr:metallophosphoesterase-domain-containing protein [Cypionkella sp.]